MQIGLPRQASRLAPLSLLCLALAACTVGPDFKRPDVPAGAGYAKDSLTSTTHADIDAGGAAQRLIAGLDIPGQWWTLFRSPALNALVEEALRANPDVSAAQAALRQANELVYADQASLFPTVSANASKTREKLSGVQTGSPSSPILTVSSASLSVSYAPDVFGGTPRQIESTTAQAEYERFQLEATYLTLTSNVVNTAISLASVRDQVAATEEIIRLQSGQLDLLQAQRQLGAIGNTDVLTQQTSLAQTRATLPPLQKQLAQTRNQLMAYLGRFPNQDRGEAFNLASLHLPQELPVSLPSALVGQRPDVQSAQAQLHQASANIGVAVANQLPQFSITGSLGSTAAAGTKLFSAGTGVAAYDESAARYRGTVLIAFQDVANALRALQADADALNQQVVAERSAQANLDLVQAQFKLGAVAYINLLTAQQTYQNTVLARVRAQAARYSDTTALFQALGGGWWNRNDVDPATAGHPDRFGLPTWQEIRPAHTAATEPTH
jgi:NodT family efflux transporter outer membrane factor (OMF) lipoprotein